MENRRFILIALLGAVIFFIYQAWVKDFAPAAAAPTEAAAAPVTADEAPTGSTPAAEKAAAATADAAAPAKPVDAGARIRVQTDVVVADISLAGGELRRDELVG